MTELSPGAREIIAGRNADPFHYLGPHTEDDRTVVRVFLPEASRVFAISGESEHELERIDPAGLFAGPLDDPEHYRLRARFGDNEVELEDPYRFPPVLSEFDLYLLGEGNHLKLYDKLGAHPMEMEGVRGVTFVVWAPNARRVSVVGDFNLWDGRRHAMRVRGNGYWEIFVPSAAAGDKYKYEIIARSGELLMKADPVGFGSEMRPMTASIVIDSAKLPRPRPSHDGINSLNAPMSIYEVHLGSWRKKGEHEEYWLTYRELAEQLPAYAADMGFTHVELLPIMEHPFDGSWGYQPTGLFGPTSRFGTPAEFAMLVDALHAAGIG
ncbi:MAG: 1,4-alpha-glucan branching enzyme, partial [Pseudolabrys sp.]